MFDLWHTLGTILVFPTEFFTASDALTASVGRPLFENVPLVYSEERDAQGIAIGAQGSKYSYVNKVGGNLDGNITTAARTMLATFLSNHYGPLAPPVGIYTAGKFCQMLTVPSFDFKSSMTAFANAFKAAGGVAISPSPCFLALVGASLIDASLAAVLIDPSDPRRAAIYQEFRVTDTEKAVLSAFIHDKKFGDTQKKFLEDPPDWDCCSGQFLFWVGHNEHMVNS